MPKYTITPLGAAIVEALPDKQKANAIQRRFNKRRECPVSVIFPTLEAVAEFYRKHGTPVIAVRF